MSSIQKMSIQGIRSFGPDEKDKQIISFFSPLTLILGPNGTGKTTIIECLKYMTTGEMPPNAKTNAAFIHDPKIAMERLVKAQVKLQFKDVRKQTVVAVRSLTATQNQNAKSVKMATLDSTITRINEHGEKNSLTSRCAEMNQELVALLGVSKPVLENVIFCHQEDANWPLSEGKSLKEKFDDIFASTRYVKALEVIRKTQKDQTGTIKECAVEIKHLKQNKEMADKILAELADLEARYISARENVEGVNSRLKPIEDQLEKLNMSIGELHKLKQKLGELKVEIRGMEKAAEELRANLQEEFQGSTEELKRTISEFQAKVQDKQEEMRELERQQASLERDVEKLRKQKSKLLLEQGKLQQEAERQKQTVEKRDRLLAKVAEAYDLQGYSGSITSPLVQRFLRELEEKAKGILSESNTVKAEYEERERKIASEKDAKASSKTKLETETQLKTTQLKSHETEIRDINRKLSEVEASAGRLSHLSTDLKRAEHQLKDLESSVNPDSMKSEIKELSDTKAKHDTQLKSLDVELGRLSKEASVRSELEVHKKDRTTKEDQINRLRAKNEDALKHLLGAIPEQNLLRALNAYITKHSRSVKEQQTKLEQLKHQETRMEMDRKNQMDHLKKKEEELKGYEEKIYNVCSSQNLDEGMETAKTDLENQQKVLAYLKGTEHVYQRFMDKMDKANDRCPLCMQSFPSSADAEELITSMENKLSLVPSKVSDLEAKLDRVQRKYDDMLQLKPIKEALMDIEKEDIPKLKEKISTLNTQIEGIKTEIAELEEQLESGLSDEAQAKSMITDMTMIDRYTNELKDVARKISALSAKISGDGSGKTMQEIQQEREDLQLHLETVSRNMELKRTRLDEYNEQLQALKAQVNELGREKLQIESDLQQRSRLEKRKEELQEVTEVLMVEIDECKVQLQPLQEEMRQLEDDVRKVRQDKEEHVQAARDEFSRIKTKGKEIGTLGQEIQSYMDSGKDQDLKEKGERMKQISDKMEDIETERSTVFSKIQQHQRDIAAQSTEERNLRDNLDLRKKRHEIERKGEELAEKEEQFGGLDVSSTVREEQRLRQEQERMLKEKHTAQGRLTGYEDRIKDKKDTLRADQYVDAEKKYTDKMIEYRTTQMANDDLDKYYKALDKAIMSYHEAKMREINKIIRELWTKTYKGNDIETIEIRSDDEGPSTATKRRVYHYRVVMIKGETALDMRGRCSAGQKVLASLIIRLALAETFCLNCGILALDEPTTNLDRENIESLAYALVEIITSRQKQRNFQLIIITHDEDFVELLGRSEYVDEFFKVRKNDLGCSQLVKARVADLHTR